ncbi:MAG TPA: glycosyltransferase [Jatrophihabitantaceae bacterium]
MRAAIYDKFWRSMGGGERHCGMIAQLLSQSGTEVDLIGHQRVSLQELGDRLALDLSKVSLVVTPDRGEKALSDLSADYDLFVNATYMSRVIPRSARSAYLCFFPTPEGHDLSALHRAAIHYVGPRLGEQRAHQDITYGTGWFPPEGGRRRQWAWSGGKAVIHFAPGESLEIAADFGRPGSTDTVTADVELDGETLASFPVGPVFTTRVISVPASPRRRELHLSSPTFTPGPDDPRQLGVAMSRLRLVGTKRTVRTRVADRYPWLLRDLHDISFVEAYDLILANSAYTQQWIKRLWRTDSEILFPPIEVSKIAPSPQRQKTILSVGRFMPPGHGHSKRQMEIVRTFGQLVRSGALTDWKLVVLGGCEPRHRPYLDAVRKAASGLPVEIHANAPRALVESHMSTASIFWSATGLGEDTEKRPWTNEHFGMTTAEAMVGGCTPVVIDRAGQQEIVRDGVDGFRWNTVEEWRIRTVQVATDEALRARLAASAIERVQQFSDDAFALRWNDLAATYDLMGP